MFRNLARLMLALGLAVASMTVIVAAVGSPFTRSTNANPLSSTAFASSSIPIAIALQPLVNGLAYPTYLTHAGDNTGRLFVLELAGRVRVIENNTLVITPYLDISPFVLTNQTGGLLGLAFDPNYASNGIFYLDYTTNNPSAYGAIAIVRYTVSDTLADVANPIDVTPILTITVLQNDHNGGQLAFDRNDGYLYIGVGDGGGQGDPYHNGQLLNTLQGKILRLNVRSVPTYTIPASNPFTRTIGARPEIWAYGLRNPWRFSFDQANGDLYIGDVGQDCYEEIDYQSASSHGGANYGWSSMEGYHAFNSNDMPNCNQPVITPLTVSLPITSYSHSVGEAVIGGYVYRGRQYPWMQGVYLYGDFMTGKIWMISTTHSSGWNSALTFPANYSISSFGEDQSGELYVLDINAGRIDQVVAGIPALVTASLQVSRRAANTNDVLTYTITLRNAGYPLTTTLLATDMVPNGLSYIAGTFRAASGITDESLAPKLIWHGGLSETQVVTLTYAVTVSAMDTQVIVNSISIDPMVSAPYSSSVAVLVNGRRIYLPLIFKSS